MLGQKSLQFGLIHQLIEPVRINQLVEFEADGRSIVMTPSCDSTAGTPSPPYQRRSVAPLCPVLVAGGGTLAGVALVPLGTAGTGSSLKGPTIASRALDGLNWPISATEASASAG